MKAIKQLNDFQRKELQARIRRECVKELEKYDLNIDTLIVYTLHNEFGFGMQRIEKFFNVMGKLRYELKEYYNSDIDDKDDVTYDAMRIKLKADGIDIEELEKKIEVLVQK